MSASVGNIQQIDGGDKVGPGFVLHVNRQPIVSFIFDKEADAQLALKKMTEILAAATVAASGAP